MKRGIILVLLTGVLALTGCQHRPLESVPHHLQANEKGFSLGTLRISDKHSGISLDNLRMSLARDCNIQETCNLRISREYEASKQVKLGSSGINVMVKDELILEAIFLQDAVVLVETSSEKAPLCHDGIELVRCGEKWEKVFPTIKPYLKEERGPELVCIDTLGQRVEFLFVKETLSSITLLPKVITP